MTTPPPKRRTRRLLQFSLRSLLVFVLLVSIGMSWLGVKLERARKQREAVEAIREAAAEAIDKAWGIVLYDYEFDAKGDFVPEAQPFVPSWLLGLFGRDFSSDVVEVAVLQLNFDDAEASHYFGDDEASHLKVLTELTRLNLSHTEITDAGLGHLEGLTSLTWLDLRDTQITDAGLKHLEGLTNLTTLDLRLTQVTPEGVKKLQRALPECEIVYDE